MSIQSKAYKHTPFELKWRSSKSLKAIEIIFVQAAIKASILLLNVQKVGEKSMECFTLTIKYFCL